MFESERNIINIVEKCTIYLSIRFYLQIQMPSPGIFGPNSYDARYKLVMVMEHIQNHHIQNLLWVLHVGVVPLHATHQPRRFVMCHAVLGKFRTSSIPQKLRFGRLNAVIVPLTEWCLSMGGGVAMDASVVWARPARGSVANLASVRECSSLYFLYA